MVKLFSRILLSNWKSLLVLFFVIFFASTGFIMLRQITTNIDVSVASETRPLFGADLIVSPRGYASGDILPLVEPALRGESYVVAERREFSTTLLDNENKAGLVQVVAYSGSYPQRGVLKLQSGAYMGGVVVTKGLSDRFARSGAILLDNRMLSISGTIIESSDLGFSLGTENHLIVVPVDMLSGSLLLSSGSRLDHDLLISFDDERRAPIIADRLKKILSEDSYRVRTYEDRTERNLETVQTLTDYITLILLVSAIFAFVILRSAHETFFESLARTLKVTEILGLTQKRQRVLLLMLYSLIFPLAFIVSLGLSDIFIEMLRRIPEASEFRFFWSSLGQSFLILLGIIVIAWFPIWYTMGGTEESKTEKKPTVWYHMLSLGLRRIDVMVPVMVGVGVLFLLFGDWIFALGVSVGAFVFFVVTGYMVRYIYQWIFLGVRSWRKHRFYLYDALRALVRPLTPTIPITLSLVSVTVFFLVFATFSLAFRDQLVIDSTNTANVYAINILPSDKKAVERVLSSGALLYDILRARISKVNGKSLSEHLSVETPSGEFTREFNITTTPTENAVIAGKKSLSKGEVSVDDEFSKRLGVAVGDNITFLLSGRAITLTVANIRESVREGFRPFFYFSFDANEFANAPRTYFVAEYAPDVEAWKKEILAASGPHVTFIDIESILAIVRDISEKVLSVIGLFFGVVLLFALGAIIAFFTRMRRVEDMKSRLYSLFGAPKKSIQTSLMGTRVALFVVSYILSLIIGLVLSYIVVSTGGFFRFSLADYLMIAGVTGLVYVIMIAGMRR